MSDEKKSLDDSKNEVLADIKNLTGLDGEDLEKFSKAADKLIGHIKELRTENSGKRLDMKDLQEKYNKEKEQFDSTKSALEEKIKSLTTDFETKLKQKDEDDIAPLKQKLEAFESYETQKRTDIKNALGDKWLTSFETMPLYDLEKLSNNLLPDKKLVGTDNGKNKKQSEKELFTQDELKALTTKDLDDPEIFKKAERSMYFYANK